MEGQACPLALQERPQYLYHFVLHAALDAVEEAEWHSTSMHLGVVDRFNSLQVSAFTTATRIKFLLLHEGRSDDLVKSFFRDVYELYLRVKIWGRSADCCCIDSRHRGAVPITCSLLRRSCSTHFIRPPQKSHHRCSTRKCAS